MSMNDMQVGRAKQHHVTQLLRCSLIEIQADFSPTALPALRFFGRMGCFCNELRINFATCGLLVFGLILYLLLPLIFWAYMFATHLN